MNTRTWAEIDLDALTKNIKNIRAKVDKQTMVMAVVKADAYGHGAVEVSRCLLANGADCLAVADLDEAIELREAGIDAGILILGVSSLEECEELVKYDITATVFNYGFAKALSDAALKLEKTAKVHIKIDTGMSRIGYLAAENDEKLTDEIIRIAELPNLYVEGIFSHFATADEKDNAFTKRQLAEFLDVCNLLSRRGLKIPIRHIANSAGIMSHPETHLEMVRAGVIIYGLYPSNEVDRSELILHPVMKFKSRITHIKEIKERSVSYGREYIAHEAVKVATVPVGYADGYTRMLSGKAKMITKDKACEVIGRICMDQCMIDVTNVHNINVGDEVIIFGDGEITAEALAETLGTINYEVVCMVSRRIPRIYLEKGGVVGKVNYLRK